MAVEVATQHRGVGALHLDDGAREPGKALRSAGDADVFEPCVAFQGDSGRSRSVDRGAGAAESAHDDAGRHGDRSEIAAITQLDDVAGSGVAKQRGEIDRLSWCRLEQLCRPIDVDDLEFVHGDVGHATQ